MLRAAGLSADRGSRRAPIFGPEAWADIAGMSWCHFDRWFALVAVTDFDADLDALRLALEQRLSWLSGRRDVEGKLSHLADLRDRLARTGVDVRTIAAHECPDKVTSAKARRKVLDQALEGRAMTGPMRLTPRVRLGQRARSGHWPAFPVSPVQWYARLGGDEGDRHSFDWRRDPTPAT